MGWLFDSHGRAEAERYARDLVEDRGMRFLKWWEIDASAAVIRAMGRLRLAWNVVEISPERQAQTQAPKRTAVAA
jgi:fatty-acid desaturase